MNRYVYITESNFSQYTDYASIKLNDATLKFLIQFAAKASSASVWKL